MIGKITTAYHSTILMPDGYRAVLIFTRDCYPLIHIHQNNRCELIAAIAFHADRGQFSSFKPPATAFQQPTNTYYFEYADPDSFEKIQRMIDACCT